MLELFTDRNAGNLQNPMISAWWSPAKRMDFLNWIYNWNSHDNWIYKWIYTAIPFGSHIFLAGFIFWLRWSLARDGPTNRRDSDALGVQAGVCRSDSIVKLLWHICDTFVTHLWHICDEFRMAKSELSECDSPEILQKFLDVSRMNLSESQAPDWDHLPSAELVFSAIPSRSSSSGSPWFMDFSDLGPR